MSTILSVLSEKRGEKREKFWCRCQQCVAFFYIIRCCCCLLCVPAAADRGISQSSSLLVIRLQNIAVVRLMRVENLSFFYWNFQWDGSNGGANGGPRAIDCASSEAARAATTRRRRLVAREEKKNYIKILIWHFELLATRHRFRLPCCDYIVDFIFSPFHVPALALSQVDISSLSFVYRIWMCSWNIHNIECINY